MAVLWREDERMENEVGCMTEYGKLRRVVVCPPDFMRIDQVINETQKRYKEENIDVHTARKQHQEFVELMRNHGIEVIELTAEEGFNEQVFTRDIGVCIGPQVFISNMGNEIRTGEEAILEQVLDRSGAPWRKIEDNSIEGGDVIVDRGYVWVGLSGRTTLSGVQCLQDLLPDLKVVPIPIKKEYLHLDCVFNILSPEYALVYPDALNKKEYDMLSRHYKLIEVNEKEQFTLGVNVLSIAPGVVISLPQNKQVNRKLIDKGFEIIEVDFSEIIKSGGSFRCCTLPLKREG
ncbi:dimethylarginine dimethylaminohydrolase family protein [Thalassobacillus pellis]|uniref:dimethylarginine dimethylaminohydrolase family protein n=1 Tax=Thalassobacillus pellis TaxID=748008 RepID=UPI001960BBA4|nr:dimethylarginine dimethylaminohydrolase family protein [Thalassobacillus pellis]MBM7551810.1 N-dimethylarginine dimethylaminohydrolase [Thalassobacillus pellis]